MTTHTTDRNLVIIVLIALAALILLPSLFMGFGMMGFGMMGFGPMVGGVGGSGTVPGWVPIVGLLVQLLFLAVVVGAGYLVYRAVRGSVDGRDRAVEELRLAYARGDLEDEEYEKRLDALRRDT